MAGFDAGAGYRPETLAVRAGQERSQFGEHSEALYLTVTSRVIISPYVAGHSSAQET